MLLLRDENYITNQELEDAQYEISRLVRIVELDQIRNSANYKMRNTNSNVIKIDRDIDALAFSWRRYSAGHDEILRKLLKELNDNVASGIGISEAEKMDILKAMDFSKGHWFKCPNGHVYAIGECGGATQESRCNECGAVIGGHSHRLHGRNQVASEMDGATQGAYDQAVHDNLRNFDFFRFV